MPELPEVETIRRGLSRHLTDRVIQGVEVYHPRALRRHLAAAGPPAADVTARLTGRRLTGASRRGKYLWLGLDSGEALLAHLGMSGQLLVCATTVPDPIHLRLRLRLSGGEELRYVDQRTFGGLAVENLVRRSDGLLLPPSLTHIAADPLGADFDLVQVARQLRARRSGVKRALLDQTLVSGIGNIYADETLWRARVHFARPARALPPATARRLLREAAQVLTDALAAGGTSFDALYVDVTGAAGFFARELAVYGRAGLPCRRCGSLIRRDAWTNRSSFSCPRCQPRPRRPQP